jgi:hypothetical protein
MATSTLIDLSPIKKDLTFRQGSDVNKDMLKINWAVDGIGVNLSAYSARAHFGLKINSPPLIILTSTSGGIVLNEVAGQIEMIITAAQTASLTGFVKGVIRGVWDLELINGSGKTRSFMAGVWTLTQDIPHA